MKPKRRWLLLIIPLALFVWAYQAASWRPKLVGVQPIFVGNGLRPLWLGYSASTPLLVSPDGKWLASSGSDNQSKFVMLWDTRARQRKWQIRRIPPDAISLVAFSPDSRFLAVAVDERPFGRPSFSIHLVETATGKERPLINITWQTSVQSAAFLSNRELVISKSDGASVVDTQTGKVIRSWKFESPLSHMATREPFPLQSHVAANGTTVLALHLGGSTDGNITKKGNYHDATAIEIYDSKTGKRRAVWTFQGVFQNPRLSPDGTLWTMEQWGNNSTSVGVYDAQTGQKIWGPFAGDQATAPYIWSADSQYLVLTKKQTLSVFGARSQKFLASVPRAQPSRALALSPHHDFLYNLDYAGKIRRWRLR